MGLGFKVLRNRVQGLGSNIVRGGARLGLKEKPGARVLKWDHGQWRIWACGWSKKKSLGIKGGFKLFFESKGSPTRTPPFHLRAREKE